MICKWLIAVDSNKILRNNNIIRIWYGVYVINVGICIMSKALIWGFASVSAGFESLMRINKGFNTGVASSRWGLNHQKRVDIKVNINHQQGAFWVHFKGLKFCQWFSDIMATQTHIAHTVRKSDINMVRIIFNSVRCNIIQKQTLMLKKHKFKI